MQFMYVGNELYAIDGDWQDVNLVDFHSSVTEQMNPKTKSLLELDITRMNLNCIPGQLSSDESEFMFMDESEPSQRDTISWLDYDKLVREYMQVLKNFITVNIAIDVPTAKKRMCTTCIIPLQRDEHNLVCPGCLGSLSVYQMACNGEALINVSHEMRSFRETVDYLEGHIDISISSYNETAKHLDAYFKAKGMIDACDIRCMKTRKDGTKKHTSRLIMTRAIKCVKFGVKQGVCAGNYINYFLNRYWGWSRIDISSVRSVVTSNQMRVLQVIGPILALYGRKTNIGQWLMLSEQLRLLSFPISDQYFKAHKTEDVVEVHKEIIQRAFTDAGI